MDIGLVGRSRLERTYETQLTYDPNAVPVVGALYNPNADDNPGQDLGNRCVEIGSGPTSR